MIDESPSAYKNVDDVMKLQEDLVRIVNTLKQETRNVSTTGFPIFLTS